MSEKPHVDVRILKIELADIAREFAVGDNSLVYIAQLESQNAKLLQAVNDKDQELFESQELVGELLEALEAIALESDPVGGRTQTNMECSLEEIRILADIAIRKAKGE